MEGTNTLELISIITSVVSVALAIFAIWLSVVFYRMSSRSSEDLKNASSNIDKAVSRLETLFNKLYSDTFGIVKDTVTDMRQQLYKPTEGDGKIKEQIEAEVQAKVTPLKEEIIKTLEIQEVRGKNNLMKLNTKLDALVTASMAAVKEVKGENNEEVILNILRTNTKKGIITDAATIGKLSGLESKELIDTLHSLRAKGKVSWGSVILTGFSNIILNEN